MPRRRARVESNRQAQTSRFLIGLVWARRARPGALCSSPRPAGLWSAGSRRLITAATRTPPTRWDRRGRGFGPPLIQPSPNGRRVGIRIVTFEACSGFTHVTARRIAQPPKAAFVARLRPVRLPDQAARQLPDQSTTIRVESSSTDDSRLRGALPGTDIRLRG